MSTESDNFVSADITDADLLRLAGEISNRPFSVDIECELRKFLPYSGWGQRMRDLLAQTSQRRGAPNPAEWENETAVRHLKQTRYVLEICDAAGLRIDDFDDLLKTEVLEALRGCVSPENAQCGGGSVTASNHPPAPRHWGYVSLGGSLKSLRTVCAVEGLALPAKFQQLIALCSDLRHRRDVSSRVRSRADYLVGAAALDAYGRITTDSGRRHKGEYFRVGARLLAVTADGSPRRNEIGKAERTRVRARPLANRPEKHIHIRAKTSKVNLPRLLVITDEVALRFLQELQSGPGGTELFRSLNGRPLSLRQLDLRLWTASKLAVGARASYNILRKSNSAAMPTSEERARQLGQSGVSVLADKVYHPKLVEVGRLQMAQAREEHTRRARTWVENVAASDVRRPPTPI